MARCVMHCVYVAMLGNCSSINTEILKMNDKTCDVVTGNDNRCGRQSIKGYNCVIDTKNGEIQSIVNVCERHCHAFEDFIQEQTG